jgi:sodium-dependent phosphate cotransporter
MISKLENLFDRVIFKSAGRGLVFGLLFTILVQSSSVTTSLAVPLVGAGILTIAQVLPNTMGANIGTTVTALLASLAAYAAANTADPSAMNAATLGLQVAFHHVLFNVIGVFIVWWFRWIPIRIAEAFARLAAWNRFIPLVYILITFYVLPFLIIWLGR